MAEHNARRRCQARCCWLVPFALFCWPAASPSARITTAPATTPPPPIKRPAQPRLSRRPILPAAAGSPPTPPTACCAASGGRSTRTRSSTSSKSASPPTTCSCARRLETYLAARDQVTVAARQLSIPRSPPTSLASRDTSFEQTSRSSIKRMPPTTTTYILDGQASWEPDFWGRVRRTVEAARANCASQRRRRRELWT